jgi:hypothetical protein
MGEELLLLPALEVVIGLEHLDLAFPVVPRAHDAESVDEEAGADLDAVVLEDGDELLLGEDLRGGRSTLRRLLSEPCWSSAEGDLGS